MGSDVWEQWSTQLPGISLSKIQTALCASQQDKIPLHKSLGEHLFHLATTFLKSLLKTDLTVSNKHQPES